MADPCDVPLLAAMPSALRSRVLRRAALDAGADGSQLAAVHVGELDRLVTDWHGQERVELPGKISASRVGDALLLHAARRPSLRSAARARHPLPVAG